jgi:hypothetical protein
MMHFERIATIAVTLILLYTTENSVLGNKQTVRELYYSKLDHAKQHLNSKQAFARRKNSRNLFSSNATTVRFELFNAITDLKISDLRNGTIVNIRTLNISSPQALAIVAILTGNSTVRSVKFSLDKIWYNRIEGGAPYTLCGNSGLNYSQCLSLTLGNHIVEAIPYSERNATGQILGSNYAVKFQIINALPTLSPSSTYPFPTIRAPITPSLTPTNIIAPTTAPVKTISPSICKVPKVSERDSVVMLNIIENREDTNKYLLISPVYWTMGTMAKVPSFLSGEYGSYDW